MILGINVLERDGVDGFPNCWNSCIFSILLNGFLDKTFKCRRGVMKVVSPYSAWNIPHHLHRISLRINQTKYGAFLAFGYKNWKKTQNSLWLLDIWRKSSNGKACFMFSNNFIYPHPKGESDYWAIWQVHKAFSSKRKGLN
jgi:hypothetical protein